MRNSKGALIGLFGPDGSGKSTGAEAIERHLRESGIEVRRLHWRPGFLPYRRDLTKRPSDQDFFDPQSTKVRRGLKAWLVLGYVVADFLLGYWFKIRKEVRRGVVVLHERYFYDVLIDPQRYGLGLPFSVRLCAAHLVPSTDLNIVFDAPTEVLFDRKKELSVTEIDRQRRILKSGLSRVGAFRIIDSAVASPDEIAEVVCRLLRPMEGE